MPYNLWIYDAFFGLLGSYIDINVLEHSFIFRDFGEERASKANYSINGKNYSMKYYLVNGIYSL